MNVKSTFILFIAGLLFLAGCRGEVVGMEINSVQYSADSGAILPEMQWHEEILITRDEVVLTRTGKVQNTIVNEGAWEVGTEPNAVELLFKQLKGLDCSSFQRVEPQVGGPDGGGSSSYTVTFTNGQTCELFFSPGVSYSGGSALTEPVDSFIRDLNFPPEARIQINP